MKNDKSRPKKLTVLRFELGTFDIQLFIVTSKMNYSYSKKLLTKIWKLVLFQFNFWCSVFDNLEKFDEIR